MRNTRYELFLFSGFDFRGMEEHFERMAQRGWLLCGSKMLMKYRRIEPHAMKFCVVSFPKGTGFEPQNDPAQAELRELCEADGWKLAADFNTLLVFYNEQPNPHPIETDPALQLKNIRGAMHRNYLATLGLLLLMGVMQIFAPGRTLTEMLSQYMLLFQCLFGLCMIAYSGTEIVQYLLWSRRAGKAADADQPLPDPPRSRTRHAVLLMLMLTAGAAMLLSFGSGGENVAVSMSILIVGIAAVILLRERMRARNVPQITCRLVVCLLIAAVSIASTGTLTWLLLNRTEPAEVENMRINRTALCTKIEAWDDHCTGFEVYYETVEPIAPFYDACFRSMQKEQTKYGGELVQTALPGLEDAQTMRFWRDGDSFDTYLIGRNGKLLVLNVLSPQPTETQIAQLAEKLMQ